MRDIFADLVDSPDNAVGRRKTKKGSEDATVGRAARGFDGDGGADHPGPRSRCEPMDTTLAAVSVSLVMKRSSTGRAGAFENKIDERGARTSGLSRTWSQG